MTIPFIRRDPNGKRKITELARPEGIETMAHAFLGKNGRYLCEVLKSGQAHFFALIDVPDEETGEFEPRNVCAVTCDNDSETADAVDWLVKESIKYIPEAPRPQVQIPTAKQVRRLTKAELKNRLFLVD